MLPHIVVPGAFIDDVTIVWWCRCWGTFNFIYLTFLQSSHQLLFSLLPITTRFIQALKGHGIKLLRFDQTNISILWKLLQISNIAVRKRGSNCVLVKEGREEERRGGLGHRMAGMMRNRYRVGHLIPSHFPFPPLLYVNKVWKLFLFSFGRWKFLQRGEEGTKSDFNLTDECIKEVSAKHSLMRLVLVETMNTAAHSSPPRHRPSP